MTAIMEKSTALNELLKKLISEASDLIAALIIDSNGLIIAQQSIKSIDEQIIEAIISILEQNLEKMKNYTEISIGSGTIQTNEFQIFYVEMKAEDSEIFVLVADPYSSLDKIIPFSFIVAEKASGILNNQETSIELPYFNEQGDIECEKSNRPFSMLNRINKVVIIGPDGVGKSTLVNMYINGNTAEYYRPTIGLSIHKKKFHISKNIDLNVCIFDMGGLKSFAKVRKHYYKDAKVVIILFDYSQMDTIERVHEWIEESRHFIKNNQTNFFLVGNKIDLVNDRDVIRDKAMALANQYGFSYYETSAITGEGLDELFTSCITNLL